MWVVRVDKGMNPLFLETTLQNTCYFPCQPRLYYSISRLQFHPLSPSEPALVSSITSPCSGTGDLCFLGRLTASEDWLHLCLSTCPADLLAHSQESFTKSNSSALAMNIPMINQNSYSILSFLVVIRLNPGSQNTPGKHPGSNGQSTHCDWRVHPLHVALFYQDLSGDRRRPGSPQAGQPSPIPDLFWREGGHEVVLEPPWDRRKYALSP